MLPPGELPMTATWSATSRAISTPRRAGVSLVLMTRAPPDPDPISTAAVLAHGGPVKNRKSDSMGRSSRSARSTGAPTTAPPKPDVSAAVGDIEMVRERTRARIALAVIALALLALVILSGVIGLTFGKLSVNDVKELVASQTALITLVGTAMGFYFSRTMR
jgi:hypothetical protein